MSYEVGIYPREGQEESEYAVFCTRTRTWSDFQGNVSEEAHTRVSVIALRNNRIIQEEGWDK